MVDVALWFGGDLSVGPTGDIALAGGSMLVEQRVLRRLLTNAGDYIWQRGYGAGLGKFVGEPAASAMMAGVTRIQMLQEAGVASTPAPRVTANATLDGTVNLLVQYADAQTGYMSSLNFSV
ncbi:MAG: hypothetical protein B7W99_00295 [Rhodospirillales bacterium 20-58-10]|nr:MAG: hypothetical protein B7W99_00295 [Rhodospirillales bacterium 20-58-10]